MMSQEDYTTQKLTPLLELLVRDVLRQQPADPKVYMKEWLDKRRSESEAAQAGSAPAPAAEVPAAEAPAVYAAAPPPAPEVEEVESEVKFMAERTVRQSIVANTEELSSLRAAVEAPFLHQFFQLAGEVMGEVLMTDPMELMFDPAGQQMIEAKMASIKSGGTPLLEQSFKHHDSNNDGVLDAEEAAVFFAHVVAEEGTFMEMTVSATTLASMKQMMQMAASMGQLQEMKAEIQPKLTQAFEDLHAEVEGMKAAYQTNKAERDAAAFKICDTNGDGTLQLEELVAALVPGEPKNEEFTAALGFQSAKPPSASPQGGDCPQQ